MLGWMVKKNRTMSCTVCHLIVRFREAGSQCLNQASSVLCVFLFTS